MPQIISRRQFLMGCSSAIAALAGSRLTQVAFAQGGTNQNILVVVFLRGAWDAINVLPPIAGADRSYYEQARTSYLRYPASGPGGAISIGQLTGPGGACVPFGMHPSFAPLLNLYQSQKVAFVLACGMNHGTRSHFDAMQFMELGTPGVKTTGTGWITRHLQSAANLPPVVQLPAVAANTAQPTSLLAFPDAVAFSTTSGFGFNGSGSTLVGGQSYSYWQQQSLRQMYTGVSWLDAAGLETLDTVQTVQGLGTYTPLPGAVYPSGSFGTSLRTIAQLIKAGLGLQTATIDLGGWDTHEYQGATGTSYMPSLLTTLAQGLQAFYIDLDGSAGGNHMARTTVVVMSEFGRRLRENASQGSDHGHGSAMILMGGAVNGGRLYGRWPGLANNQLFDGADLAVTTDYRTVLSELLVRRMGNGNLAAVFPDVTSYDPLGVVQGSDTGVTLPPAPPPPPLPPGLNERIYMPLIGRRLPDLCNP